MTLGSARVLRGSLRPRDICDLNFSAGHFAIRLFFRVVLATPQTGTRVALSLSVRALSTRKEDSNMRDSQAKRILFTELRRGPLTEVEASLWPAALRSEMIREGVVRRRDDGGIELANPTTYSSTSPPASIAPPSQSGTMPAVALPTITARVPQEVIDYLDTIREENESRGGAIRRLLGAAVERGLGKPANIRKTVGR